MRCETGSGLGRRINKSILRVAFLKQRHVCLRRVDSAHAELVVSATPCDLAALIDIDKPVVRARYEFAELGEPSLGAMVEAFLRQRGLGS